MSNPDTIIFLHIPKTAGTTLTQILQRQYKPQQAFYLGANAQASIRAYQELPAKEKASIRLVAGHTAFGFHRNVQGSTTYFTFLREPIERVVSFYHFVKNHEQHYLNHAVINEFSGIGPFLSSGITTMVDNGQTRMISGAWLEPEYGQISAEIFEQAKANLGHSFGVVGLTEQFDATLLLLRKVFKWQNINYFRQNVTKIARRDRQLTAEEEAIVLSSNQWDMALYEYAQELFQKQITSIGPDFANQLEEFRRENQRYQILTAPLRMVQRAKRFSIRSTIKRAFRR